MGIKDLFTPDFKSEDPAKRLKALESLKDQSLLAELAMNDPSPRVRTAAARKITEQEQLIKVALDGNEIDARLTAVEKIDSQEKLAEIIKRRKNYKLMGACFERITDREILSRIANDPDYNRSARRLAIENYADEAYLSDLQVAEDKAREKSPEEIAAIIDKYGGEKLVRVMGKFRGSKNSILALGQIMQRGGDSAVMAMEYLAKSLNYANPIISRCAEEQLAELKDPELIARLIAMIGSTDLDERITAVLKKVDHPDAREFIEKTDN